MALDPASSTPSPRGEASLLGRYRGVRSFTQQLCADLEPDDQVAQSMPDASPTKWHLAHTTWFFETFVLEKFIPGYAPVHPDYNYLFNSYYNAVGDRHARTLRGVLTRPTCAEIDAYRAAVDEAMTPLLEELADGDSDELVKVAEVGINHEQQHQELILTDLKHLFSLNVLAPAYRGALPAGTEEARPLGWTEFPAGVHRVGHSGDGFAFDNEGPVHRVFLEAFALADRLVTNGEFQAFIRDDGYRRPELWLDSGWDRVQREGWERPIYWRDGGGDADLREFSLAGERSLVASEPVSHVSFLEADAYARWAGARLPFEAEWEIAAHPVPIEGNFVEDGRFHPAPAPATNGTPPAQLFGDLWEWTQSAYGPYPGYRPPPGALGEYNGKFMCEQMVLRGGSCATSRSHVRSTYRNFFRPPDRWQFTGVRLARTL